MADVGPRSRGLITAFALASFLGSPLMACASEVMTSQMQQMACCEEGHHDCGAAMKPADCCTQSDHQASRLSMSKSEPRASVITPLLVWAHPASVSIVESPATLHAIDPPSSVLDTGPPDCFAFSILLI